MNTRELIRSFIEKELKQRGDHTTFADDESLFLSGRLTSLSAVKFMAFAEQNLKIDFGAGFDLSVIDTVESVLSTISNNN